MSITFCKYTFLTFASKIRGLTYVHVKSLIAYIFELNRYIVKLGLDEIIILCLSKIFCKVVDLQIHFKMECDDSNPRFLYAYLSTCILRQSPEFLIRLTTWACCISKTSWPWMVTKKSSSCRPPYEAGWPVRTFSIFGTKLE